ncbi:hypothetical protein PPL_05210 [Heterostelium album PN500]|uniref:Uncharacterized protein n=1 Tax=Heterostelium pallidum (strain ATCC 26659 / Pp 5 / PN500) TaxID=670386 RepID=D3B9R4_HETP5|nr:hypothetical protein PPL_05210 [Heterostelium album PN500]EFA81976.1 hypothetical protein PPL_05210 [Heterostelium album PN500]|eukprot:XP_020434093.1 hypothetical protein PPL_05210 [Heterostelium album PN500]
MVSTKVDGEETATPTVGNGGNFTNNGFEEN